MHPLLGVHVEMPSGHEHVWQTDFGNQAVSPAAVFAEIAVAAGSQGLGLPVDGIQVSALAIEKPLIVDAHTRLTTQLSQDAGANRVEIHARSSSGTWSRYAVADIEAAPQAAPPANRDVEQSIAIVLPDEVAHHPEYRIHPVLLDAALRQLAAAVPAEADDDTSYQPVSIETIRVFGAIGDRVHCHTELAEAQGGYRGSIVLTDETGTPVAELTGIELRPVDLSSVPMDLGQQIFDAAWVASPVPAGGAVPDGTWVVLAEKSLRQPLSPIRSRPGCKRRPVAWSLDRCPARCRTPSPRPRVTRTSRRSAFS